MPPFALRFCTLALAAAALAACDPDPGSLADCAPAAPPVALDTIDDAIPPTTDLALQAWLAAGSYRDYLPESAIHGSAGPHGGEVRTYLNRTLTASLAGCTSTHPTGAAAVKELYDGDALEGWAVMVKTEAGRGADRWFWYEVYSTAPDAEADFSGQGDDTCTGCHDGGLDAVRTRWPLR